MKLSENQIQDLFSFVRKHFVEHYDLQTELVDHLANGIEEQWQEHPNRSYKDARLREFRKFGVTGFESVVQKRSNAMSWRYFKIVLRFYREYFRLPKIIMTVTLVLICALGLKLIPLTYRYDVILGLMVVMVCVELFFQFRNRKNNELERVKKGRKWMLKDQIYSYGNIANIVNLFPIVLNIQYFRKIIPIDNSIVLLVFAMLIVGICILSYLMLLVIPKKAEELLAETYPEYKMA